MTLFLVRHGIAEDEPPGGKGGDDARPLSARGRRRTCAAARGFAAAFGAVDAIVSSPLLRARQTADLLAEALRLKAPPAADPVLRPEAQAAETVTWLAKRSERSLVLVGHMPHLESLASLLVAGREGLSLPFRKAGVCELAFDGKAAPGNASLVAFLPARVLRKVT